MSIKHQPSRTPLTLMCPGAVHSPLVSSSTPVPLLSAWVLGFCRLCSHTPFPGHSAPCSVLSFESVVKRSESRRNREVSCSGSHGSGCCWKLGTFAVGAVGKGCPPHPPSGACWLGKLQEAAGASSGGRARSTGRILISAHHSFLFIALPPSLPPLCSASPHKSFVPTPSHLKYIPWFFFS